MAKKFVRGITDINKINDQDFDTNNVNDLLSDGEHNYIHRKKKDKTEEYHNLTDNIKTISSDNTDLLTVTNNNKTNNTATLHPKHDAQKEQLLESERATINIHHGANGTAEKTKVDTNPQKVLEHNNLTTPRQSGIAITHINGQNTTSVSLSPDFIGKISKMDTTLNTLKAEGLKPFKELGFNINDNIPELFTSLSGWGGMNAEDVVKNGNAYTATIRKANQGMVTNPFTSTKSKVVVHIKGTTTVANIGVHVQFIKAGASTTNKRIGTFTGKGNFDKTFTIDPSSLSVYDDALSYSFQIITNSVKVAESDDPTGTITIESLSIKEVDSLQLKETYDTNLRQFLNNIASNLETVSAGSKHNSLTLTSPNNTKYRVLVKDNGDLYTKLISFSKVLYLGNSILMGANTDGTHGRPFGLGATSKAESLEAKLNKLLGIKDPTKSTLKHDSEYEQSQSDTTSKQYISTLSECMTPDTDLVIIQIGDNVNNAPRYRAFTNNFDALIKKLQSINSNATILIAGAWYDSYYLTQWLSNYASQHGLLFTNLRALNLPKNQTTAGLKQTYDDGTSRLIKKEWETHPGDAGYTVMANAIYETLTN